MSNVLDFQVSGAFSSKVGGTGTGVKYFPRPLGPSIGVAPATPSATSAAGALFLPAQNVYNGQQFDILASGSFGNDSGDPSGVVTVNLYAVTGTFANPTYTSIASTGNMVPFYTIQPWGISANLVGASVNGANGLLIGNYTSYQRGSINSTPAIVLNTVSGLDFNAGNPALQQGAVLGFVVGVLFGTSDASNTATLNEFTVET